MRGDVPGTLIRRWTQQWQPELAARIAQLREVDLASLDDTWLDEHLGDVLALTEHGQIIHFRAPRGHCHDARRAGLRVP
jgi:hypothetical protein